MRYGRREHSQAHTVTVNIERGIASCGGLLQCYQEAECCTPVSQPFVPLIICMIMRCKLIGKRKEGKIKTDASNIHLGHKLRQTLFLPSCQKREEASSSSCCLVSWCIRVDGSCLSQQGDNDDGDGDDDNVFAPNKERHTVPTVRSDKNLTLDPFHTRCPSSAVLMAGRWRLMKMIG